MLERIIENWLDKSSEKTFQKPLCYMLSKRGYTIIHLTRHSPMEMGKDIIAIDPEGIPCAFQLKGAVNGKISMSQWRNEINRQLIDLASLSIIHPSIDKSVPHRSFFVTNGVLEEEVSRAIDDLSQNLLSRNVISYGIETIVKGQILDMAMELENSLWPSEVKEFNVILEFLLESGSEPFLKEKFSALLESILRLDETQRISKPECQRLISSTALLCSICTTSYVSNKNHLAEIEAWMIYISYIFAFSEKYKLRFDFIDKEFEIARQSIFNGLGNFVEEIKERKHLIEGDPLVDQPFFGIRINWILALVSIYWLWRRYLKIEENEDDNFLRKFYLKYENKMFLWGESAIPQFLTFYWFLKNIDATPKPDFTILYSLIEAICVLNKPRSSTFLANPYYDVKDIMPYLLNIAEKPLDDNFNGNSYFLEGLVHLFVRRNWKSSLKFMWPSITRINISEFVPHSKYHFYRWRNKKGTLRTYITKSRQDWMDLRDISSENNGECIPRLLKNFPVLVLLFICVYPHRANSKIIKWLDYKFLSIK